MKKKVLLVVRWPVGGIRTFLRYVYRDFNPERWHFTIVAPNLKEMGVLMDDLSGLDVSYLALEENPSFITLSQKVISSLIKEKYDLVHSHGFTSGLCSVVPARLFRIPHLMTSHDVINDFQFLGIKGKLRKQAIGIAFGLIDKIQSVSYDAQQNLLDNFPRLSRRKGKCIVIPNGIEIERFVQSEVRDFRSELGLNDKVFLIGFLGRFMSQKGLRYLVDAIDNLSRNSALIKKPLVLTFGDGGFSREEKAAIKERGLETFFNFLPFAANVASTIKGLDVVVMPSLWEACPLQPMEALICGTPFIGTDCIGLREVLGDTPATIVPMADASALAETIRMEIESTSKEKFMRFRGAAIERYDVNITTEKIHKLYNELIC